ncbi:hypothetical protein BSAF29S_07052 [Bacillus safensis subsp. safensis]
MHQKQYNLVSEIEAFSHDKEKMALHWQDGNGHEAHVTYAALVEEANKIGHVLLKAGFKKGDKIIVMVPRHTRGIQHLFSDFENRNGRDSLFRNAACKRYRLSN